MPQAPSGTDTVVRNGTNHNTATKLQCISAMKQYEGHSIEVGNDNMQCDHMHWLSVNRLFICENL